MTGALLALGHRLNERIAAALRGLTQRHGSYPRLPTCCQLERLKGGWRARL